MNTKNYDDNHTIPVFGEAVSVTESNNDITFAILNEYRVRNNY